MKYRWDLILIIGLFIAWFFKYYIDIILGKYGFIISFTAIFIWLFLCLYTIFLILKYLIADTDVKPNVKILLIIIPLLMISLFSPNGLVNWEKLEPKNLLIARYEGTVNCQTYIKIRANNALKVSSYCFGTEHLWGKYSIINDTIFFELPK